MMPTNRSEAAAFVFATPCCGARPHFNMTFEGPAYMQSEVVDSIECPQCDNSWHPDGTPSQVTTTPPPEERDWPEQEQRFEFFERGDKDAVTPPGRA